MTDSQRLDYARAKARQSAARASHEHIKSARDFWNAELNRSDGELCAADREVHRLKNLYGIQEDQE